MAHQNLFEALERIAGFTALETDMFEIIEAVDKDKEDQFTQINIEKKIDRTCSNNCSDVCGECQIQTKQTAVEWMIEQIQKQVDAGYGFNPRFDGKVIDQAKKLEKQQIVESWNSAYGGDNCHSGEQYYNETYGKD